MRAIKQKIGDDDQLVEDLYAELHMTGMRASPCQRIGNCLHAETDSLFLNLLTM